MNPRLQQAMPTGAAISLVALIFLCLAWELFLAPLRPGGSWLVLKALPLLIPLRGVLKRDLYTMQWASMMILIYFGEGLIRGLTDQDWGSSVLAWIEVVLCISFFLFTVFYLSPFKKAAKALARQAIEKASQ